MTGVTGLPLHRMSALLAAGETSSRELTAAHVARIRELDPALRAFVTPTFELALDMATEADAEMARGRRRGPLHGIPVALKDAFDTAGIPTTVCSRLFADRVPGRDAEAWRRLRSAGAILLGKLECTELCLGGPSLDGLVPHAVNPWSAAHSPGGSSSGAGVALAAGMIPAALGSDTGGSIRIPATFCGVAGLKPTAGLVSRRGLFPLSATLDDAGPMARTARDCALLLDAIAGPEPGDPAAGPPPRAAALLSEDLAGLRVGHVRAFTEHASVSAGSRATVESALAVLQSLGAEIREVSLPDLWAFTLCQSVITLSEAFALHGRAFRERAHLVSRLTRARITLGAFLRAESYLRAEGKRRELARATLAAMSDVDVLVYPAAPGAPPRVDSVTPFTFLETPLLTAPANVAGVPAMAVRAGFSSTGLPMGIQITGRHLADATVLRVAHAYELATPEHGRIAPVGADASGCG